tara:strand:- start:3972 stop:5903 length:1932 start_codon:yes stop_codon:yes gene_type:complete
MAYSSNIPDSNPAMGYVKPERVKVAKFDNLSATLSGVEKGIDFIIDADKKRDIEEARESATKQVEDYKAQSPAENLRLQEEKQVLEAQIRNAPQSDQVPAWKTRMDEVTGKLTNAVNQEKMSPYEFQRRSNAAMLEQIEANPAYRDEIVTETQKVYQAMGISDIIAMDEGIGKAEAAQNKYENKEMDKLLIENKINPFDLDDQDKGEEFNRILNNDRSFYMLEQAAARGDILDQDDKRIIANKVKNIRFNGEQGYEAVASYTFNNLGKKVQAINESDMSAQEKQIALMDEIRKSRGYITYVGTNYTKGNKDTVTRWYNEQILMFNKLETDAKAMTSGEFQKKNLQTLEDTAGLINKLDIRRYSNPEALDAAIKMRGIIKEAEKYDPGYQPSEEEKAVILRGIESIRVGAGQKISPSNSFLNDFYGEQTPKKLRALNIQFKNALRDGLEIDEVAMGYVNNVFTVSEIKGRDLGDSARIRYDDTIFTTLTNMDDSVMRYFIDTQSDFRNSLSNELQYYKTKVNASLNSIKQSEGITEDTVPVQYYKGTGMFFVPSNRKLDNEMSRVNKYIQLTAKQQGVKPSAIAEQLINEFPIFAKKVVTEEAVEETPVPVEVNTEVEQAKEWLKANPDHPDAEAVRKKIESMS